MSNIEGTYITIKDLREWLLAPENENLTVHVTYDCCVHEESCWVLNPEKLDSLVKFKRKDTDQ